MNNPKNPTELDPSRTPSTETAKPSEAKPVSDTPEGTPAREASPAEAPLESGVDGADSPAR